MPRCSCIKKDLKRCTRDSKKDTNYCWQHQNCPKPIIDNKSLDTKLLEASKMVNWMKSKS